MSWKDIKGSKEDRQQAIASAREILETAKSEDRDLTGEEVEQVEQLQASADALARRIAVLEADAAIDAQAAAPVDEVPERDRRRYSMLRALSGLADHRDIKSIGGIEAEMHQELMQSHGKTPKGLLVPEWAFMPRAATLTTSTASGPVGEEIDPDFAGHLKAKSILGMLGARILTGLSADRTTPVVSAGVTASWGETDDNQSEPTIGSVTLSPNRVSAYGDISKVLLAQTSNTVEDMVRDDFVRGLAAAVEGAALIGGGSDEPEGIIDTISATTADGELSWSEVVAIWSAVATQNADIGDLGWACSPTLAADMMTTVRADSTDSRMIMNDTNRSIMGYPVGITSNVTTGIEGSDDNALIYGNWNDLVVGFFGAAPDVTVDPYSQSYAGKVRVTVEYFADVILRREDSFAYSTF